MRELILSATAVLCAVLLLRGLLKKRMSMRLRYALWALVLVRLLVPFSLPSPASVLNLVPPPAAVAPAVEPVTAPVADAPQTGTGQVFLQPEPDVPPAPPVEETILRSQPVERAGIQPLWLVWLLGACCVGIWFAAGNLRFLWRLRRAERCDRVMGELPVYRADSLPSPCLVGLMRPRVYLTGRALERPDTLRHVLTHEECHWRQRDNWWALLRGVCLILWWFHPLVWVAAILSRRDCELACDEAAVRRLGEDERIPYGQTLIALVARRPVPGDLLSASTAMTAGGREIKERVIQVAKGKRMPRTVLALVLVLAIGAGACTLTGAADRSPERLVKEFVTELNTEYYTPRESDVGGYQVAYQIEIPKRALGYEVKEPTAEAVGVAYETKAETQQLMANIGANWTAAFGQQFYHLPQSHPLRADRVELWMGFGFYSRTTASGTTRTVNGHEGIFTLLVHPAGGFEQARAYLDAAGAEYGYDKEDGSLYLTYRVNLVRSTRTNGQTLWTGSDLTNNPYGYTTDGSTEGDYTPMALPVTVKPRPDWQVAAVDLDCFGVPDDKGLDYYGSGADRAELIYRWAYAYGQMYYALPESNPYHAAEVRLLEGQGSTDFTLAVKPAKGVGAVRGFFPGFGCPEGTGDLAGFVLLRYQVGLMRQTVGELGTEPVWVRKGSSALWSTTPCPPIDQWTAEDMAFWGGNLRTGHSMTAQDLGRESWNTQGLTWAEGYTWGLLDNYGGRNAPNGAYQTQVLEMKLTGASSGDKDRVLEYSLKFAYLPTWGVEKALAWHRMDGERYVPREPEDGKPNYRPQRAAAGTGDLTGWVVVEIPSVYLQYETTQYGTSLRGVGMDGYGYTRPRVHPLTGEQWMAF